MRSIFNEKVTEKCSLWTNKQYMRVLFTGEKSKSYSKKKKRKKKI